jgi:hypothetical protein
MKNILLPAIALVSISLILTSCGPSKQDALTYNDKLVAIEQGLSAAQDAFFDQLDGHNADSLKLTQQQYTAKAKTALEECEKLGPFNGKSDYLDPALTYFKTINSLATKEAVEITTILSKDTTQLTEEDFGKAEEIATKLDGEYEKVLLKVQAAQDAFAAEWHFEIADDKK